MFVIVREPAGLLGEVEIAEDPISGPERHAQECSHRRVMWRKTDRVRMILNPVETDGLGLDDQAAQHSAPGRKRPDRCGQFEGNTYMDELDQGSVLSDPPDCRVFGPGRFPRRIGRGCKQLGKIAGGGDGSSPANQRRQPLGRYSGQRRKVSYVWFKAVNAA